MSKASELEAARLAAERLDARCKAITRTTRNAGLEGAEISEVLADVATQLLAEATYISEQRKSGWKSRSDAHTAAGRILEQWAKDLATYLERDEPPMRPPLDTIKSPDKHAGLDPADGPISAQITSGLLAATGVPKYTAEPQCHVEYPHKPGDRIVRCGKVAGHDGPHAEWIGGVDNDGASGWGPKWTLPVADQLAPKLATAHERYPWPDGAITPDAATRVRLATEAGKGVDDKLDAAFGPVTYPDSNADGFWNDAVVHITAAPANYAWCDATTGMRGYVGTANCPDCIARWDAWKEADALRPKTIHDVEPRVVLLTGSRDWTDVGLIHDTLAGLRASVPGLVIRHGDCPTGADAIAKAWCDANAVAQDPVPADWAAHGKAAGPIRNQAMLDREPRPETYVAFHKGQSRGTQDMIDRCRKAGIRGKIYGSEQDAIESMQRMTIPQFSEPGPAPARQTRQRMTFEQVRQHGMARARGEDHRSYSQVQAFSECGIRYALSDLDVTPAWWNVGGTALHYACEAINTDAYMTQVRGTDTPRDWTDHAAETLWTNCLNRSVSETITEHPTVGPDTWRAAKKGAEGYDWWRTNGVDMVRRWITRLTWLYGQGWTIATVDGKPAIEFDAPMFIMLEPNAPGDRTGPAIKVENIIDLVMTRADGTLLIIDFKSGASDPTSTYQLGQYGHALDRHLGDGTTGRIRELYGAHWLARTDMLAPVDVTKTDTATDLRELHPWAEIEYLITTMHAAESQGLYLPNKSKSDRFGCGSCGVAGLCPVGPR